jgi:DtxR family Mn-dependent transcriptional regulator
MELRPLNTLEKGVEATIARLKTSDPQMLQHMLDRGFVLNAPVKVVERDPFDGPITVRVDGKRRVIGHQVAENILVSS